ncbi:MAG: hypothetical protein GYA17_07260, partial [Chloroflexi bacterium]|nr:hypothetical protein [Chloroflexota bacterium]
TAAPDKLVGPGSVELAWSVSGAFDSIKITNGSSVVADGLAAQGFNTVSVSESGTYVLTATYAGQSAGANLKITVDPALIEPNLKIINVYPEDDLELGDTTMVSISMTQDNADDPPPTGDVIITDGNSSCAITLPKTSCRLTFETPGVKYLTATYEGDTTHLQTQSAPYGKSITVLGNTISLSTILMPNSTLYRYNQKITLRIVVAGTNPNRVPDGELRVRRMCDPAATYAQVCTDDVIGYHKLTSADSGSYRFVDLVVDQVGGDWNLQVTFIGDSFYSNASTNLSTPVDNTTSPVSVGAATTDPLPALVGRDITYTVTVRDENANNIYSTPKGTATLTATHTDGTVVQCLNLPLVDRGNSRTATVDCTLNLPKSGLWTMVADFVISSEDIIHKNTSQNLANLTVNSNINLSLISPPSSLTYGISRSLTLELTRTENAAAVTIGTLACAFPAGSSDGSCTCSYTSGANWRCTLAPTLADTLPVDKTVTFTYAPATSAFLNDSQTSKSFRITKAGTTASLDNPLNTTYSVGETYELTVLAAHSSGGSAPTSGTVTAKLGTGACSSVSGMTSGVTDTFTGTLNVPTVIKFEARHLATGAALRFCYRYEGNGSYEASAWYPSSNDFMVTAAATTASIAVQPEAEYALGGAGYAITVNATRSDGGGTPTNGGVTIQLGSGTCNPTTGMSSGALSTYTGVVGSPKTITFDSSHVIGQDVKFCVRYDGDGDTFGASPYVSSSALRVKAAPTWSTTSALSFVASQTLGSLYSQVSLTLNNAITPDWHNVRLVLTSAEATVMCPSDTANFKCVFDHESTSDVSTTYVYSIGATSATSWAVKAVYNADEYNRVTNGAEFSLQSQYSVSMGTTSSSVSGSNNYLWAYSSQETATGETMET